MEGNPTDCMGLPDYLGWKWKSKTEIPIVCVPGCPVQPDNFMETLLYLLYMASGRAPMIPLDEALRPTWLFGSTVHEGCDRGGYYEQAQFAEEYGSPQCIVKLGLLGSGGAVQRGQARMDWRNRRLPQRGWNLHWLHHAGVSRQIHALHEPAARLSAFFGRSPNLWSGNSCIAQVHTGFAQQSAELASTEGFIRQHSLTSKGTAGSCGPNGVSVGITLTNRMGRSQASRRVGTRRFCGAA